MRNDFHVRLQPKLTILNEEQKEEIHLASLEILERTGILVQEDEAVRLLSKAGCYVKDGNRVFIPAPVLEEAIRSVPKRIAISNRLKERVMFLEDRKSYFGTGSDTPNVLDIAGGEHRKAVLNDVRNAAQICDSVKNIDFVMSMALADDVPASLADRYQFEAMVSHTTKPIMFTAWNRRGLEDIYHMAIAVAGGEENLRRNPFLIHYSEPIAPLVHPKDSLQKLLFCAEKHIPVEYHSISMAGATAPATLMGSFVQANARMLSGLVIHQLKQRGAPLIVQSPIICLDMRTTLMPYFGPDWCLGALLTKEMALYYEIPTFGKAGATDAKVLDQQAGIEIGMSILLEGLVGNNLIHDIGYLENGLTSSLASIVICDEVISHVRRFLRGIDLSPDHMAISLIDQVGPQGNYLALEHTFKFYRKEGWFSKLIDHERRGKWLELGSKTMLQKAEETAKKIIESHEAPPLSPEVKRELEVVLRRAQERSQG
ncbi:MAG: trimethylamine methyltransferase family protein [Thermodesulfobacteriota bacterium]